MEFEHDQVRHRFTTTVDGQTCELDYRLAGNIMTITHTGVPEALAGRGIASVLTRNALDHARARGWKVVPACSYAIAFMKRFPEYNDVLAAPGLTQRR